MPDVDRRQFLALCAGGLAAAEGAGRADALDGGREVWDFEGQWFRGQGDAAYLKLLDTSYRMLWPQPDVQNLSMLYSPAWNGFVEGPTWGAWWIQNSYGPSYCGLPFFTEPYSTFLENAQDLWFSQMGDGKREGAFGWTPPDGCLCDAASPGWIVYRQGDGRTDIHDWAVEFTAAGIVLQAEMLLISRDEAKIAHYLPMLERCAEFIESRRDPANDLFLAGPAANLLAPSYAGWKRSDGTYDKAYLTGLSVSYIAALDRLIELGRLVGDGEREHVHRKRRDSARAGLSALTEDEGYLIKSLDPDGARHGVYGAERYGYLEAVCNHDAVAFRVVGDKQARQIVDKIASIPGLRPHDLIITNYPSLDDMYTEPSGLWQFGTWVNGGHWTTCEARMILAYYRVGRYDDARRSMERILEFAREFRLDNPLVEFGAKVYQPNEPINCCYDSWGAPTAMLRGLFEYIYHADRLTLIPHIPPDITALEQRFPVRFGEKRIYLATEGSGPIQSVRINGWRWDRHTKTQVELPYSALADQTTVLIGLGDIERPSLRVRGPFYGNLDYGSSPDPPAPTSEPEEPDNGLPLRIGADSNGEHRFVGRMMRVGLWSRALTDREVAEVAASRAEPPHSGGPTLGFDLDSLENGKVASDLTPALTAIAVGEFDTSGDGARFRGDAFLEVASDKRLALGKSYTVEAWILPESLPEGGVRIVDHVTAGVDDGYLLDTHPSNALRFITPRGVVSYDAQLPLGEWSHAAGTLDAETLKLYLDGQLVATAPAKPIGTTGAALLAPEPLVAFVRSVPPDCYEALHARLVLNYRGTIARRATMLQTGELPQLAARSQAAADRSYRDAAQRLADGLARTIEGYEGSDDPHKQRVLAAWRKAMQG
jgi:hypothetical protein